MGSDIDVMKFVLFNQSRIKELLITKRQRQLILSLSGEALTSRDIANEYEITVQSASQQLSDLCKKGFVSRVEVDDKTGGYFFEYTANQYLFEDEINDSK